MKSIGQIAYDAEMEFFGIDPATWFEELPFAQESCRASARAVLAHAAKLLREEGQKANTYDKQAQWEAAALLLEQLK